MKIVYKDTLNLDAKKVKQLYEDVKWIAYTKDLPKLLDAINHSLKVISAWDDEKLVGLIRVVGDGLTILYIQDILVLEDYQNLGIGSELLKKVLELYKDVRQKVLLTENDPNILAFYVKNGFTACGQGNITCFYKFD